MSATMTPEIEDRLRSSLDDRGKLPCPAAWKISQESDISVRAIGDWANANDIRIGSCALGCFK